MSLTQISAMAESAAENKTTSDSMKAVTDAPYSNVYIVDATYTWYWIQDELVNNYITIYNAGPYPASGIVIVWSAEDGYGYGSYYYNLGVGNLTTVSVPFLPAQGTSVGLKPIVLAAQVGTEISHAVQVSDGIEKYNNAAGYLTDPYGGDSLSTSDLHHFPFGDGYSIIYEAAVGGDNTYTPGDTAYELRDYVHAVINPTEDYPWGAYTASDLYMISHETNGMYRGVCDEYATLYTSFERSLGVPTQKFGVVFNNQTGYVSGHALTQIWNGNSWLSVDPSWNSFNDPQVYKRAGYLNISLTRLSGADDSVDMTDPYGDGLLNMWSDFTIIQGLGLVPEYN